MNTNTNTIGWKELKEKKEEKKRAVYFKRDTLLFILLEHFRII